MRAAPALRGARLVGGAGLLDSGKNARETKEEITTERERIARKAAKEEGTMESTESTERGRAGPISLGMMPGLLERKPSCAWGQEARLLPEAGLLGFHPRLPVQATWGLQAPG
jgi:hypothetical protein